MSVTDVIKMAIDVAKETNRLELAEQLVQLRNDMLDLKEDNIALRQECEQLKQKLSIQEQIVFENGQYWILIDPMTADAGKTPICGRCWDVEKMVVRLKIKYIHGKGSYALCPECKSNHDLN